MIKTWSFTAAIYSLFLGQILHAYCNLPWIGSCMRTCQLHSESADKLSTLTNYFWRANWIPLTLFALFRPYERFFFFFFWLVEVLSSEDLMLLFCHEDGFCFAFQSMAKNIFLPILALWGMIQYTSHLPLIISKVAAFQQWYLHAAGIEIWQLIR